MKLSLARFPTFSFSHFLTFPLSHFPLCSLCLRGQGFLSFPASSLPRLLTSSPSRLLVFLVAAILFITQAHAQVVEIPDPNLREVIREALQLSTSEPITQQDMEQLTELQASRKDIMNLVGLESATALEDLNLNSNYRLSDISPLANLINLKHLYLSGRRGVSDITPLTNLTKLETLHLSGQAVVDITPLANLTRLVFLSLEENYVTDISSLATLVNLQELWINQNPIENFTPVSALNLTTLYLDEICEVSPLVPSTRERIESRSFPSIFQAWSDVVGLDHLTWEERNTLHDLHWSPTFNHTIQWDTTSHESSYGLATNLAGTLSVAHEIRQRRLNQNPNMIFLRGFAIHVSGDEFFPPDSDFWLRDENGHIIRKQDGTPLIDFVKPEVQNLLAQRIIAVERCGLYDGIFVDGFGDDGTGFVGSHLNPSPKDEMVQAVLNIFRTARLQMRDDFLIIVNGNEFTTPLYADLINGTFMEIGKDYPLGYFLHRLRKFEAVLSWSEEHLRSPQINCLEGEGMSIEPPDGPNNLRWMRLFTTLALTHSDGYVLYTIRFRDSRPSHPHHGHLWHNFWDAGLGRPVGSKAQTYQNIEGLFIREFSNGWAVYNRSGKGQTITLPRSSTGVSSNKQDITHLLPDLDGEIYLRIGKPYDLNRDGTINVLDLIIVSQHFGKTEGDINGDGTTNILDLTLVSQQFSQ